MTATLANVVRTGQAEDAGDPSEKPDVYEATVSRVVGGQAFVVVHGYSLEREHGPCVYYGGATPAIGDRAWVGFSDEREVVIVQLARVAPSGGAPSYATLAKFGLD
jgi:hypothetical protein